MSPTYFRSFYHPGVVNVLVTTPLWVVNTRLKLQGAKFRNTDIRPTHYTGIMGEVMIYQVIKNLYSRAVVEVDSLGFVELLPLP